ncbi:VanZ family protein [Sedimentibacter sp. zth1]|uniref:VanZ family protein n=1 Tax=Sedimentibacter sp. zth1 TaxID=2816908 RepID=UPI001A914012|nr:VanZ family protein [Sedimentibacter sp. zth1]QSX04653.1 VanZ family protein [Sedimentibacter sp. zth1]
MLRNKKAIIILVILIIVISLIKLNPFTKSAQANKDHLINRSESINLKPFSTITNYITNSDRYNKSTILKFFVINLVFYLPIAFFLGLSNFNKPTNFLIIILLPIAIDLLQVGFKIGRFDIDAILLNILISLIIFCLVKRIKISQT